jgi:hypothetical protein
MTTEHPITPPPELFNQWEDDILNERDNVDHVLDCAWRHGFRTGADQELEACRMEIIDGAGLFYIDETSDRVRLAEDIWTARRPKPPSLKEQALEIVKGTPVNSAGLYSYEQVETIRRALESLPE